MNGQQSHSLGVDGSGRQHAAGLERAHKRIRRGVTSATELQRHPKQRTQVGQHGFALVGRCSTGEARQHIAIAIDRLQRVMGGPLIKPALPSPQTCRHTPSIRRESLRCFQQIKPRRLRRLLLQGKLHQNFIAQAKQGRLEHARQRQVVLRRDQYVKQGHQVLHFAAVDQICFFTNLSGKVQLAKLVLQRHQTGALARQNHDVGGSQGGARDLLLNPGGDLARLQRAQCFFGHFARGAQAVAPSRWHGPVHRGLARRARNRRQFAHQAKLQ